MTTRFQITSTKTGVTIEVTGVGDAKQELLTAFGECQAGQCSCPTNEYEKVERMDVESSVDVIAIRLQAKPGTQFDTQDIAACLDHTVGRATSQ